MLFNYFIFFSLQTTKLPTGMVNKIETTSRKFVWGNDGEERRINLVSWEKLCKPKEYGRLGLRRLKEMNEALLNENWLGNCC